MKSIRLLDEIDEKTFNKIAKYTPTVKGRLKNVRNLELIDTNDDPELEVNRAKSLFFGSWKEMSKKNIQQIKGLRLHLLELPYQLKCEFQTIYGIKLRQLHLISKTPVTTPNYNVTD